MEKEEYIYSGFLFTLDHARTVYKFIYTFLQYILIVQAHLSEG